MGVLSNRALAAALDSGLLHITPRPTPPPERDDSPFGTSSVDLRLSPDISIPRLGLQISLDVRGPIGSTLDTIYERREIPPDGWVLKPNQFVLGRTLERVELPLSETCLAARIEGRSSFARAGLLVHFTAPTIHPGFAGTITLEMINLGGFPLVLWPSLSICQLIVETVEGAPIRSDSQFHGQASATGMR